MMKSLLVEIDCLLSWNDSTHWKGRDHSVRFRGRSDHVIVRHCKQTINLRCSVLEEFILLALAIRRRVILEGHLRTDDPLCDRCYSQRRACVKFISRKQPATTSEPVMLYR